MCISSVGATGVNDANSSNDDMSNLEIQSISNDVLSDNNSTVLPSENNANITTNNLTMDYKDGSSFKATVTDSSGKPIVGTNVSFTIYNSAGVKYPAYTPSTDANGTASLAINLAPGVYKIVTSALNASDVSNTITVNFVDNKIVSSDLTMDYDDGSSFTVNVTDSNGNPVVGETVTFTIYNSAGVKYPLYKSTTNTNGSASLAIHLAAGKYKIISSAICTKSVTNTITVEKTYNKIISSDLTMDYKDGSSFSVNVTDKYGNPLANKSGSFTIYNSAGVKYPVYPFNTNVNGTAALLINLAAGKYKIVTSLSSGEDVSNTIVVNSVQNKIISSDLDMSYKDGSSFSVNVTDSKGNPLANETVLFTIYNSAGVKYPAYTYTTNVNGTTALPINLAPGSYKIKTSAASVEVSNKIYIVKSTTVISGKYFEIFYTEPIIYNVTLTSQSGNPVSGAKINFKVSGKSYGSATTNDNGVASINIKGLSIGCYKVDYSFTGNTYYTSSSDFRYLKVINSTTIISGAGGTIDYGDNFNFTVTLKNISGTPLPNKVVNIAISSSKFASDAKYNITTNSDGIAYLPVTLNAGTYTFKYSYSTPGKSDYASGFNTLIINKQTITLTGSDLIKEPSDEVYFNVTLKNKNGNVVSNVTTQFTIAGVTYDSTSKDNGVASLRITLNTVGIYEIKYNVKPTTNYESNVFTNKVVVNGSIISGENMDVKIDTVNNYSVTLTNVYGNPLSGKNVNFILTNSEGKILLNNTVKTDSNGVATVTLPKLSSGKYVISYSYNEGKSPAKGQSSIEASNGLSLKSIMTAATNLKNYIESYFKLPSTVTVDSKSFSTAQFLYILSKATIALNNGDKGDIFSGTVKDPSKPSVETVTGNLYLNNYVSTAQDIINYIDKNGVAPDSVKTALGTSGYEPLVYAFARIVSFYETSSVLPSYVSLKSVSAPIPDSPLDDKNTIPDSELYKYLADGGWKCDVDNPQIQKLAAQLTAGKDSDFAKATAIFNYVRDEISYSFYYNSKYGATDTLFKYKTANCCDLSNALVALYRAAGLPCRYVHGTCTFSSGLTCGHVWVQVLIGDTWVVADSVSSRNSLGVVVNWDNYHYTLHGKYAQLSF